jgi:hypothetical protein
LPRPRGAAGRSCWPVFSSREEGENRTGIITSRWQRSVNYFKLRGNFWMTYLPTYRPIPILLVERD